jgi:hypothetical protein
VKGAEKEMLNEDEGKWYSIISPRFGFAWRGTE